MMTKQNRRHVIERAAERYGVRLSDSDVDQMLAKIEAGDAVLWQTMPRKKVYMVRHNGTVFLAVTNGQALVTLLPPDAATSKSRKGVQHKVRRIREGLKRNRRRGLHRLATS